MKNRTILLCLICIAVSSVSAFGITGEEILKKVDRNMQPQSYEMYKKLINVEPDGKKKEFTLYMAKKGNNKIIALFIAPESEKGRATLRLGDNMWLHIPNVGKPVRITSLQSVVGGVFNNSDIMQLDFSFEYKVDKMTEGKTEYTLHLKAKNTSVAYDRLEMTVDKKDMIPIKIECYTATKMLIKTLYYKEKKDFGDGVVRPSVMETDSPLHKGYKSIMIFARVKKRDFSDEVFTLNYLPRVGDLR